MKKDWRELISQPKYEGKIKIEKDVYVTARDGTRLALDVYRPDVRGKFPALFSFCAYGKELQYKLLPPQPFDKSAIWDGNIECGDVNDFVARGYAHVIADIRGTGYSEGEYLGFNDKSEGTDGYDIIEWIAEQPWCNGNVGMVGYSYCGEVQPLIASEQPPHLKAIYADGVFADLYRGIAYPGGQLSVFLYGLWDGRAGTSGMAVHHAKSVMLKELSKPELERRRQELLNNPDIANYPNMFHLLNYPFKNPMFYDLLMNPFDGPYYWERSIYTIWDKVKCPTYSIAATGHNFVTGNVSLYQGVKVPKKLLIGPPGRLTRPWRDHFETLIRWNDHWLKGNDTGIMDEPPIKFYVVGENDYRYAKEWPLKGTEPTKFYLRSWEEMSTEPELYQDQPDSFVQQPLHVSAKRDSVSYTTAPMTEELTVIGPAALYFSASIDQNDTNWVVSVFDVNPNGKEQLLSKGRVKASHRTLDKAKSTPLQPYHTHKKADTIIPGEIYEYAIDIVPLSIVFKPGHSIKLNIQSMESPRDMDNMLHYHPPLNSGLTVLHKIYRDKAHPSHLLLPVIPKK